MNGVQGDEDPGEFQEDQIWRRICPKIHGHTLKMIMYCITVNSSLPHNMMDYEYVGKLRFKLWLQQNE